MLPEVKSILHEQCCVKELYTEHWKNFEQVHSWTKRNYENMFFSDEACLCEAEMQEALLTNTSFAKILVQFLYVPHS